MTRTGADDGYGTVPAPQCGRAPPPRDQVTGPFSRGTVRWPSRSFVFGHSLYRTVPGTGGPASVPEARPPVLPYRRGVRARRRAMPGHSDGSDRIIGVKSGA
eukprot:249534-Hanusia_phi.AAC.2